LPNDGARGSNRLLKALPEDDYERLRQHLRPREVHQREGLGESGQRIVDVHFPVDAVVSILTRMDEGPSVEIATIGNEGVVGLTVAWGSEAMNPREVATVQAPGEVVSMAPAPSEPSSGSREHSRLWSSVTRSRSSARCPSRWPATGSILSSSVAPAGCC
jgi:hypothetical protein